MTTVGMSRMPGTMRSWGLAAAAAGAGATLLLAWAADPARAEQTWKMKMKLAGKLVEAGTQTPIAGADVWLFEGRQVCMSFPARGASGECEAGPPIC
ncbi:MAG: hypothetical protein HYV63_10150, partial [Candidatus Schekmanbacteria bacterium]|nr:hypothetical protein [Candidatus Schekmanbacteria bacterium]